MKTTLVKNRINQTLQHVNLRLDTLTAETVEAERIRRQIAIGQFEKPAFPLLVGMRGYDFRPLVEAWQAVRDDCDRLMSGGGVGYDPDNTFFRSPDAELLYLMVRRLAPKRIIEIGSGNSTRIIRQAILDGGLSVQHLAIDPEPRADIDGLTDRILYARFEETDAYDELGTLGSNDILFIDSSHQVHVANDVAKLFCKVLPALAPGVVVHVHDVFLPFDYPEPFCTDYPGWGEQYLLQVMLASRPREILWPGYYVQQCHSEARDVLPFLGNGRAQSFWFRV